MSNNKDRDFNFENLTLLVFTRNRQRYVKDIFNYWKDTNINLVILDGSDSPTFPHTELLSMLKNSELSYHYHYDVSLSDRFINSTDLISTKYAIWHADDDIYLKQPLHDALKKMELLPDGISVFSTVRGFTSEWLEEPHDVVEWKVAYELLEDSAEDRLLRFAQNRANRYYYAIWESNLLKKALHSVGTANKALMQNELVFWDIGLEISGCVLSKLMIHESNFILKRVENHKYNIPSLPDFRKNNFQEWNEWIRVYCKNLGESMNIDEGELSKIVTIALNLIIQREEEKKLKRQKSIMSRLTNWSISTLKKSDRRSLRSFYKVCALAYRLIYPKSLEFSKQVVWDDWDLGESLDLQYIKELVRPTIRSDRKDLPDSLKD